MILSKERSQSSMNSPWILFLAAALIGTAAFLPFALAEANKDHTSLLRRKVLQSTSQHFAKITSPKHSSVDDDVAAACRATLYPDACRSALAATVTGANAGGRRKTTKELFDMSVQFAAVRAHAVRSMAYNLSMSHHQKVVTGGDRRTAMDDCTELMDVTVDQLNDVITKSSDVGGVQTWLSSALTNQVTCMESLGLTTPPSSMPTIDDLVVAAAANGHDSMAVECRDLMQHISNSLALHMSAAAGASGGRKLLSSDGYPSWLPAGDRKLLEASPEEIKPDAVVADDGSGTHRSIKEALAYVSLAAGGGRSVIYVKAGTYRESINVGRGQRNVMLMGDGKGKSVIVGSKSVGGGSTTYDSATVAAMGPGFIAKGLTIINDAGPGKQQAVALRVGSDLSVVTQCSLQGYQDTLYTHSNRQFYRDNDIYGTVDFIFGNSAAVIQNCNIQPIKPMGGQRNSVTAQGRTDPNQNTGISIHNCRIQGYSTYLGRPWQKFARVVVMETYLDGSVVSAGWEEWSGSFALSTLYYGEYSNSGPGSSISGRVGWPGVHSSMSTAEASKFTVANFIYGNSWLPSTGVDYTAGL